MHSPQTNYDKSENLSFKWYSVNRKCHNIRHKLSQLELTWMNINFVLNIKWKTKKENHTETTNNDTFNYYKMSLGRIYFMVCKIHQLQFYRHKCTIISLFVVRTSWDNGNIGHWNSKQGTWWRPHCDTCKLIINTNLHDTHYTHIGPSWNSREWKKAQNEANKTNSCSIQNLKRPQKYCSTNF